MSQAVSSCYIIEKDKSYLSSVTQYPFNLKLNWSIYKYDAAMLDDLESAREIADMIKANVMLFNPLGGTVTQV